jgi:adenosine/AMP kinase
MELHAVRIDKPDDVNLILGQSHFIKTVEDLHEALVGAVPGIQFGLAFCEASAPALIRASGTSSAMVELAKKNALALAAGHCFIIFLENCYPINVLNAIKATPEVCRIYCATANPVEVVVAETDQGRGILGVVDGIPPKGVESEQDVDNRVALLRRFGYKLG